MNIATTDLAAIKAHAEAPAAEKNFALCLERWEAIRAEGSHPLAPVFCVRYLALTGQVAEALALIDATLAADPSPAILHTAASKLYISAIGSRWIRVVDLCRQRLKWVGADRASQLERVLRADFLLDLDPEDRRLALALLAEVDDATLARGLCSHALALVGGYAGPQEALRLAQLIQPQPEAFADAARRLVKQYAKDELELPPILAFAQTFHSVPGLVRMLVQRLISARPDDAALRLLLAFPEESWSLTEVRGVIAGALATHDPRLLMLRIERGFPELPHGPIRLRLAEELANQTGDVAHAMALCLAAMGAAQPHGHAIWAGERLASLGFRRLSTTILGPQISLSESVAFRHAVLTWRGLPEARSPEVWRAAAAAFPSARIRRGLAAALADEGDYAAATALFEEVADPQAGPAEWRDLAITLERNGHHAAWDGLIQRLEAAYPKDAWVKAERFKHALETGQGQRHVQPGAPLPGEIKAGTLHARRAAVRHLAIHGQHDEVVEVWRSIVAETQDPNDHYHLVLALCQAGDFEGAAALLDGLLTLFPGDYRYHLKRAQLFERLEAYDSALESFTRAFRAEPDNRDSQAGIARCLTYLGATASCEAWLDGFPQDDIVFAWAHAARAFNAVRDGRREEARAAMTRLRTITAQALRAIEADAAERPGSMWIHGRIRESRSERAAEAGRRFAADWAWLQEGSRVIVGNSPQILGSELGERIDGFDRVVRLNDFRTDQHEVDVGSRTDLWFSSANRLAKPNIQDLARTRIWISQPNAQHFPDLATFGRGRLGLDLPLDRTCYLPAHIHFLSTSLVYPRPSTGFRVICMMDLLMQAPYSIAGFNFFQDKDIHYFDDQSGRFQVGEVHAVKFERDFVNEVLAEMDLLSILD
jgi:tetratricopeptide (TPR) repeat protein